MYLQEAATLAQEIGLPGELWPILPAVGDLYLKQGKHEQTFHAYREAARLVSKLAASIKEDERRKAYLSSPLIERVLQTALKGSEQPCSY